MKIIDFYKGFEGSPEIIITVGDDSRNAIIQLRVWIGYFDTVLQKNGICEWKLAWHIITLPSGNRVV